jgi:DNA-binding CsgD family transcriptional regulator
MPHLLEDFIEKTNQAQTRDELFIAYQEALSQFGFDSVVYTFITDHPSINQKAGHGVKCNYPDDWMQHYLSNDYYKIDPVTKQAFKSAAPFSWDFLKQSPSITRKQKGILYEAESAGLNCGVGVPLYGPRGEMAGVGLASSTEAMQADKNTLSKLKLITEQFHLVYCALEPIEHNENEVKLTNREIEILKWWAAGKTADEIGTILNCSTSNIKFHVQSIYTKLNANSKILAVIKAIMYGFIPIDSIKS